MHLAAIILESDLSYFAMVFLSGAKYSIRG